MAEKARILFVDDEKRVLNSMRGLFRRDYDLYLTTVGADAINIAQENDVDVVVADQRMPGLTGTEVLGQIKDASPRTVRILLTGYADPEAVEGSINIGEVFRFLSKPCPPHVLRETLAQAIEAARTQPVSEETVAISPPPMHQRNSLAKVAPKPTDRPVVQGSTTPNTPSPVDRFRQPSNLRARTPSERLTSAPKPVEIPPVLKPVTPPPPILEVDQLATGPKTALPAVPNATSAKTPADSVANHEQVAVEPASTSRDDTSQSVTNIVLSENTVMETQEVEAPPSTITYGAREVAVIVFTVDSGFAETAIRAFSTDRKTILATSLIKVAQAVEQHKAGVLVTDFTTSRSVLQKMIGVLKRYVPELMTIVVSDGRDTTDMINLINFGQVFRYNLKPIDSDTLKKDVDAAAVRYIQLRNNPESIKRHRVIETPIPADASPTITRFVGRMERAEAKQSEPTD